MGNTKLPVVGRFMRVSDERFEADFADAFPNADVTAAKAAVKLPVRATAGSAGYDFVVPCDLTLAPGETVKIPTGIRAQIADGWVLCVFPRSGLGFKYRIQLDNTVGIIDSDYFGSDNEGHIFIKITNDGKAGKTLSLKAGDGFAQGIFLPFGVTEDDEATAKRNGGFGSTSK